MSDEGQKTTPRSARRAVTTIKQVADLAGVSQMTVSRVVNRQSVVRETTRQKVERAIKELHYRPNVMARGLAGGRSLLIGLVHENPSRSYLSELLMGALTQTRREGHFLLVEDFKSLSRLQEDGPPLSRIADSHLDGVVVVPPLSENPEFIADLKAAGLAYVLIAPRKIQPGELSVSLDDRAASAKMVRFLLDQGHQQIGFIKGAEGNNAGLLRLLGYQDAMREAGIEPMAGWVASGDFTYRSGMEAASQLLSGQDRPSAIFACNDDMAAGAVAAAYQQGLGVPDDVSIVGFDDSSIASTIWPPLTTMRQPLADMAASAVNLLANYLLTPIGDPLDECKMFKGSLVERDSAQKKPMKSD